MHYHVSSDSECSTEEEEEAPRRCLADPEETVSEMLFWLGCQATYYRESCEDGCTDGNLCDWCEAGSRADDMRERVDVKRAVRTLKAGTDLIWVLYGPDGRETLRASVER